jgi:hypothetical protein
MEGKTRDVRVDKWLDLLDRAGWTAVQAAGGALLAYLVTDDFTWEQALAVTATATAIAVLKVLIGQNTGVDNTGAILPPGKSAIEPPPQAGTTLASK